MTQCRHCEHEIESDRQFCPAGNAVYCSPPQPGGVEELSSKQKVLAVYQDAWLGGITFGSTKKVFDGPANKPRECKELGFGQSEEEAWENAASQLSTLSAEENTAELISSPEELMGLLHGLEDVAAGRTRPLAQIAASKLPAPPVDSIGTFEETDQMLKDGGMLSSEDFKEEYDFTPESRQASEPKGAPWRCNDCPRLYDTPDTLCCDDCPPLSEPKGEEGLLQEANRISDEELDLFKDWKVGDGGITIDQNTIGLLIQEVRQLRAYAADKKESWTFADEQQIVDLRAELSESKSEVAKLTSLLTQAKTELAQTQALLNDATEVGSAQVERIGALEDALQDLAEAVPKQTNDADWWPDELAVAMKATDELIGGEKG